MNTQNIALCGIIVIALASIVSSTIVAISQPDNAGHLIAIIGGASATILLQLFNIVKLNQNTDITLKAKEEVREGQETIRQFMEKKKR